MNDLSPFSFVGFAFDRKARSAKSAFQHARKVEASYAAKLRRIAKHIGDIVREFPEGTVEASSLIQAALQRYSALVEKDWAPAVAARMIAEVRQRDDASWKIAAGKIGRALHEEIQHAPTGAAMQGLLADQVGLITSLPLEAAQRVHKMTLEGIAQGKRADEIAKIILETGEVTKSRATLIARTETARTASVLTQARAQYVGSEGYIWRTASDSDVRASHKKMAGKFVRWDDPPTLDNLKGHAGCLPNCRCYSEPVIS